MHLQSIQNRIYEIGGEKLILDFDLAELYNVQNRALKQTVKRNRDRFPEDFMFQLSQSSWENMLSQIVMTYPVKPTKIALPLAFKEHGASKLANILKSKKQPKY